MEPRVSPKSMILQLISKAKTWDVSLLALKKQASSLRTKKGFHSWLA
jgi:hypothetical protein